MKPPLDSPVISYHSFASTLLPSNDSISSEIGYVPLVTKKDLSLVYFSRCTAFLPDLRCFLGRRTNRSSFRTSRRYLIPPAAHTMTLDLIAAKSRHNIQIVNQLRNIGHNGRSRYQLKSYAIFRDSDMRRNT
jgi:hypothetical protein